MKRGEIRPGRQWARSPAQLAMDALEERQTGEERRAMIRRGVCPDCRRPLRGERVTGRDIRVTCSRGCGYTSVQGASSGLARVLGLEPR